MIAIYEKQLAELNALAEKELEDVKTSIAENIGDVSEVSIAPLKKNILTELAGLVWLPYYAFKTPDGWLTTRAFK